MTGGFGEPTCQKCHWDNGLNEPPGSLTVAGIPSSYTPGRRYPITITLRRPDMTRGGFEMSARFAGGRVAGQQAGGLTAPDPARMKVIQSDDRKLRFIQHTKAGATADPAGALRWMVEWQAPDKPSDAVIFHVAANASNADDSPLGDYIYTAQRRSAPGAATR